MQTRKLVKTRLYMHDSKLIKIQNKKIQNFVKSPTLFGNLLEKFMQLFGNYFVLQSHFDNFFVTILEKIW